MYLSVNTTNGASQARPAAVVHANVAAGSRGAGGERGKGACRTEANEALCRGLRPIARQIQCNYSDSRKNLPPLRTGASSLLYVDRTSSLDPVSAWLYLTPVYMPYLKIRR